MILWIAAGIVILIILSFPFIYNFCGGKEGEKPCAKK